MERMAPPDSIECAMVMLPKRHDRGEGIPGRSQRTERPSLTGALGLTVPFVAMAGEPETAWPPHLPRGPARHVGNGRAGGALRLPI